MRDVPQSLAEIIALFDERIASSRNLSDLARTRVELNVARTLAELLLEAELEGLEALAEMLAEAEDAMLDDVRTPHREAQRKCTAIAGVRYFAGPTPSVQEKSDARKRIAALLDLSTTTLKNLETQWLDRQSRSGGPVSRGTFVADQTVHEIEEAIKGAVKAGAEPEAFIRSLYFD